MLGFILLLGFIFAFYHKPWLSKTEVEITTPGFTCENQYDDESRLYITKDSLEYQTIIDVKSCTRTMLQLSRNERIKVVARGRYIYRIGLDGIVVFNPDRQLLQATLLWSSLSWLMLFYLVRRVGKFINRFIK